MRRAFIAVLMGTVAACAQTLVGPDRIAAVVGDFQSHSGNGGLRCAVEPTGPTLNFAFRFQAGYTFRVPATQYQSANHTWLAVTKITPQGGNRQPVYLYGITRGADVAKVDLNFEIRGGYLLGEGSYAMESMLYDDAGRTCQREWRVDVKLARGERGVKLALPPFAVREFSSRLSSPANRSDDARPLRLTVLLNAAPLSPRRTTLRPADRHLLLGALASLLERVPTSAVKLVVFSLEQQKELLRQDNFTFDGLGRVDRAIEALPSASVDVHVLQKPFGHVDLLASLVKGELNASKPADAVVFLGPLSRYGDRFPEEALERPPGTAPRFFYLQCRTAIRRPPPALDSISDMPPMPMPRPSSGTASSADATSPSNPPGGSRSGGQSSGPPPGRMGGGRGGRNAPEAPIPTGLTETDIINRAVALLKGKSLVVRTPAEFARALRQIEGKR